MLALVAGRGRGVPLASRMIDCGDFGVAPLFCYRLRLLPRIAEEGASNTRRIP